MRPTGPCTCGGRTSPAGDLGAALCSPDPLTARLCSPDRFPGSSVVVVNLVDVRVSIPISINATQFAARVR